MAPVIKLGVPWLRLASTVDEPAASSAVLEDRPGHTRVARDTNPRGVTTRVRTADHRLNQLLFFMTPP
ncbi:MAG: hypothetical protein ACRDTH_06005 [Pseudonocardiaceae bacterium]